MAVHLYVSPEPGREWGLGLDSVAAALRQRWPDVSLAEEHSLQGRTSIHFHFPEDGHLMMGSYFTDPGETLVISGGDPDLVPEVVSWFLGLTPRHVANITFTGYHPEPVSVPAHADEATLREIYRPLVG